MVISMSSSLTPIDISNIPELVRMAEEVNNTKQSRVLTASRRTLAVLMPVGSAVTSEKKRAPTKADYDASLAALGSWRDLNADKLIAHVYRAREEGSRPVRRPFQNGGTPIA